MSPSAHAGRRRSRVCRTLLHHALWILLAFAPRPVAGQAAPDSDGVEPGAAAGPLRILDVPFVSQSEALCGGAAAAMVLRFWGERGLSAESFAHLVDHSAAGIRTDALVRDLQRRGWTAAGLRGARDGIDRALGRGRPVIALIQDRPGTFHYVVIVAATAGAIVFHDPARAPFRVMSGPEFDRRWREADYWMAIVVPGGAGAAETTAAAGVPAPEVAHARDCDRLVAEGVRLAQAGDEAGAERTLVSALSCDGSAALRELAGVRFLQRRWPDAADLAAAAVARNASDAHAWRLLATSRFLQDDGAGALAAWNAVAEPTLDLVRVDGLTRTRQRVVERLIGVRPGEVLTPGRLARARRQLADLPAALSTRLTYVPVPGGLAEARASIVERPIVPSDPWVYAAMGLTAAARREIQLTTGSLSGGGEQLAVAWRFWPRRPRLAVHAAAPAPWGGVWGVEAFAEEQPFDTPELDPSERRAARMTGSSWVTARLRWTVQAGVERWHRSGSFGTFGGMLRYASEDDRVAADVTLDRWSGAAPFARAQGRVSIRSSGVRDGFVGHVSAGAGVLSAGAPGDIWFAGDTGHARSTLLRAHPVLRDGGLQTARLGRTLVHGSIEGRHWWPGPLATRLGAAIFADAVAVDRRLEPGARRDLDAGAGARLSVPGLSGILRIDVARGLRDGATALSFAYEVW